MKEEIIERFTCYVKVDTQSDEIMKTAHRHEGQLNLAR